MSLNRKILNHQPYICTILQSWPVVPRGLTTPEQADEARASYRAKCNTRRNGRALETIDENGGWILQQGFSSINAAKAATSSRRYAV
jgi:hypothetical protein